MPVVGEFHGKFWRAKANTPPPAGTQRTSGYPLWQASVTVTSVVFGPPFELLAHYGRILAAGTRRLGRRCAWSWWIARRVWRWRTWAEQIQGTAWTTHLDALDLEQLAVLERVIHVMHGPSWAAARQQVRACATTSGFNRPSAWVEYSRALKANLGQTQNVFRHVKVVQALTAADPTLSNPDVHLLAELAYHGFAAQGRKGLQT